MIKFLKLAAPTIVILFLVVVLGMFFYHRTMHKSFDFAVDAANDISVSWQTEELQTRAHPTMIENINKSGHSIEEYFAVLSKLGALKQTIDCTLIHSGVTDFPALYLDADYLCRGEYESGPATLVLGLVKDHVFGAWQIANFHVDAPIFAAPASKQKQ